MASPWPVMPQCSKKYWAARNAVFLVSTGRYSRLQNSRMPGLLIFLISTSSHTEMVCITVSKVWYPSSRRPVTSRVKLILAYAFSFMGLSILSSE